MRSTHIKHRSHRRSAWIGLACATLALLGCGNVGADFGAADLEPTDPAAPPDAQVDASIQECVDFDNARLPSVVGLRADAPRIQVVQTVDEPITGYTWVVARFAEDRPAVWLVDEIESPVVIYAGNRFAKQLTPAAPDLGDAVGVASGVSQLPVVDGCGTDLSRIP